MAGLGVVFGAFAAHGLDDYFANKYAGETRDVVGIPIAAAEKYLNDFKTGAEYQMYHAFGLIVVGLLARMQCSKSLTVAGWCFLLGIVLFSGSLYVLTLSGQRWWGMIAPIGGSLMIIGWAALATAACCPAQSAPASRKSEEC